MSEASRNILDSSKQENKRLLREMSNIQLVTFDASTELSEFMEKTENHFMEDTFSVAENRAFMENFLHQW